MKPEMTEREVNELVELARCWCETNAAYRAQSESATLRPGDHEAMRQYLNYLDVRIQAMKHGTEAKRGGKSKIIPLATYMSWRAAK